MNSTSKYLLDSFDQLPEVEKQRVIAEILCRTLSFNFPPLSDEELTLSAEALFLSLDKEEAEYEQQLESR